MLTSKEKARTEENKTIAIIYLSALRDKELADSKKPGSST